MCNCLLVVNHAIDEWRRRRSACVDAEVGHFEHYLIIGHIEDGFYRSYDPTNSVRKH